MVKTQQFCQKYLMISSILSRPIQGRQDFILCYHQIFFDRKITITDKTEVDNKFTFKTDSTLTIYLQTPSFKHLSSIYLTVKHFTILN